MKKILSIIILSFMFLLVSCGEQPEKPPTTVDVTSIEFTMESDVVTPGTHTLTAKALPEGANQDIKFALQGIVEGVSVNGTTLSISMGAEDGAKFTVVATSLYDPTIRATKEFTVSNQIELNAIEVRTEDDLIAIGENEDSLGEYYILMNDIVLTKPWTPIGVAEVEEDDLSITPGVYFEGIFDGQGFKISGIDVSSQDDELLFNVGFFAQIGSNGVVKNTHFEGKVNAQGWSGGIAGINQGLMTNLISEVKVTVAGNSAGSLVSVNRGIISYSYGIGEVKSESIPNTQGRSAGLVAANEALMTEVYGDYEALKSQNYVAFQPQTNPNYMLSTVDMKLASTWSAFDSDRWFIADGIYPMLKHEGFIPPELSDEPIVAITNTNLELDLEDSDELNILTSVINGTGEEVLVYSLVDEVDGVSIDQTGLVTFDLDLVKKSFSFTVKVLIEDTEVSATKTFTAIYNPVVVDDTIYIETAEELLNLLSGEKSPEMLSKTYILLNNIELTEDWSPIGLAPNEDESVVGIPFTGVFDGNGYTISGINLPGGGFNKGFFGYIGEDAVVKNTEFKGYVEANAWAGGLFAFNAGLVKDVIVDIVVYAYGGNSGSLGEHNHGLIENVIVLGESVSDAGYGNTGLLSTNFGTLTNVFADSSTVKAENLVAVGALKDTEGLHYKSHEDMLLEETYSSFDEEVWNITDGYYPSLKGKVIDLNVYIGTEEELIDLLSGQLNPSSLSKTYVLVNDIELTEPWSPIGLAPNEDEGVVGVAFTGVFDGNGYTISGISLPGGGFNKGFFGYIGEDAIVKNTKFKGEVEANAWAGGLFAFNAGLIKDVIVDIKVYSYGGNSGSLGEHNHGLIENVIVLGESVSDDGYGNTGLLTTNFGTLTNVFADSSTVKAENLIAFGAIKDTEGLHFKSHEDMLLEETYSSFNKEVWNITDGEYPSLKTNE